MADVRLPPTLTPLFAGLPRRVDVEADSPAAAIDEWIRVLRPGGRLLIQQMSRTTRRGGGPFIESYIAPDMDMRPVGETIRLIQDAGFEVLGVEAMREHYARTIRAWLENFEANLPAITTILTAEQVRVWRLYLAGGALAFEQSRMGVDQILARRPER